MNRLNRNRSGLRRFGLLVPVFLVTALMAPTSAWAGNEDNIRAESLSVELAGNQTIARLTYEVTNLPPLLNPVAPFTIDIGIDRNGDDIIDELLAQFAGDPTGTALTGPHVASSDIRPALDALAAADRIQDGDRLIAILDSFNTNNELFGLGEGDNFAGATPFFVDINAKSLVLDVDMQATLAFLVNAPAKVHPFRISFFIDDNPQNGVLDDLTDTVIFTDNVNGNPGIRTITADYSATPPATGQMIFARVDVDGDVDEAAEGNASNTASTTSTAITDLVADLLTYDEISQDATLSYTVKSPADVAPYVIRFFLDRDGSNSLSAGDLPAVASANGQVSQGTYLETASFAAEPPAAGQFIFAWVDRQDTVVEDDEGNNVAAAQNTDILDLEAISLNYDSNTQNATFSFLVNSPITVDPYMVGFYLDRNTNGLLDGGDLPAVALFAGPSAPGAYALPQSYAGNAPASNQLIFASVDPFGQIAEADELNNVATGQNTAQTDLVAISLAYDEISQDATLSYSVNAPIDVAAYGIEFAVDTDGSGTPTAGDTIVNVAAGDVTPGSHTLVQSFAIMPPAAGQLIFAWIDRAALNPPFGNVDETDDAGNNRATAQNTDILDLEAIALSYDANTQEAQFAFLVNSPINTDPYSVGFYLDRDNDSLLTGADLPQIALVAGPVMPGAHTLTQSFAGDAPASNQMIFATVDPIGVIAEADELNNLSAAVNSSQTDLIAAALSYDDNTQDATLVYQVAAPISVANYNIEFWLDRDNNGAFDSVLDAPSVALVAGSTAPGTYILPQNFAGNAPATGQKVFATIDLPDPGTVTETDELGNNVAEATNSAETDLNAVVLTYDSNTRNATLAYVVQSPIPVDPYSIEFSLDSNTNGTPDAGDAVVAVLPGQTAPGAYSLSASFAGQPAASGQMVFARIDMPAPGTVTETEESLNNVAAAVNTAVTDLVANLIGSLVYDANLQIAVFNYEVVAPAPVPAYAVLFIRDTNNNFFPDFGDTIVGAQPGATTAGLHSMIQSFAASPAQSGQAIFAWLDFPSPLGGTVIESNEFNNVSVTINTEETDLVVNGMSYDSNTQMATLDYVIFAPTDVPGNAIQFYLETNGLAGLQPAGDQIVAVFLGAVTPGAHSISASYALAPPASNQILYATIDTTNAVTNETSEANNLGTTMNTAQTDLIAISLAYDSTLEEAVLSYTVDAPINVPNYTIRYWLDTNNDGILSLGDTLVGNQIGQVAPGSYASAPMSFAANVPNTGQFIFAVIDAPLGTGTVAEIDESYASNVATTSNTLGTDLVANSVSVFVNDALNETTARVSYTIHAPVAVAPFSLKVGIDRDGNGVIDGGGTDVLADVVPAMLVPGTHTVDIPNFRPALNNLPLLARIAYGSQIVATLDLNQDGSPAGAVNETDEFVNNKTAVLPMVDLVANSIAILTDASAGTTKATIAYTVDSPGAVEEFDIRVGVDRNDDGVIDDPADVLVVTHMDGNKLKPGPRSVTTDDFRAALNGITPKLKQGDFIIATIDLLQNNVAVNDVVEASEQANNFAKQKQKIDLVANSISVVTDVLGGTTEAEVAYTVNSPGSVADFSLKVGLDRDGDGKIDDPDGLLSDQLLTGVDVEPGAHTLVVPGLRAALNGLTTPIKNGDAIVMTLDLLLNGNDEGAVKEDIEKNNNSASQIQTVDLVANSFALQSDDDAGTTSATMSYAIISPADVAAFDIRIGVDRDGDDIIDGDASDLLMTIAAPDLTPGTHTADVADIRAELEALVTRLGNGDRVIATLDLTQGGAPVNDVGEAEELNNNVAGQTQTVDLVAVEINLFVSPGADERRARVSYVVNSVGSVPSFTMYIGLDQDNDGIMDAGSWIRSYDVEADFGIDAVRPGEHRVVSNDLAADLDLLDLENGQRIIATLDLLDDGAHTPDVAVLESTEVANNKTRQPLDVDLIAISLAYDSNTDYAELSYYVDSWGSVPAYDITFYLDSNNNGFWDAGDALIDTVAGDVLPGAHVAVGDYTLTQVNSLQFIFAVIDEVPAVAELDETNNLAGTDNTEITDLIANLIRVDSDDIAKTTTATVAYTIIAPNPDAVSAFDILIGVDRDGDDLIDSAADVLETIPAPFLAAGSHEVTSGNLRVALEALADRLDDGDRIIAMLDLTWDGIPVNNVDEIGGDEIANNTTGDAVSVDLIVSALEIYKQPGSGEIRGRVSYTVNSVGTVDTFNIRIGVDADGDKILDNPAGILVTADAETVGIAKVRPGDRNFVELDLTAALNAVVPPLENGDRLIATIDLADDGLGTPENFVVESEETDNNFARAPMTVDLVAQSLFLTIDNVAGTTSAAISYYVQSFGYTADFTLRIGIDRDADNIIDANAGDELFNAVLTGGDVLPGEHTYEVADIRAAINLLSPPIEYGDRIIATLDLDLAGADEAAVKEANEVGNNVTTTAGTQNPIIDIAADDLEIVVGSFIVNANYTVTSPGNVAPFDIIIGRDTDADTVIDDVLATLPGDQTPGAHSISVDVATQLLALSQPAGSTVDIVVDFDSGATVAELSELNNKLTGSGIYAVDLLCPKLTHPCAILDQLFDIEIHYTVLYNQPFENFRLRGYASLDDDFAVSPGDIPLGYIDITAPVDKTVGNHIVVLANAFVSSADFVDNQQFKVKAVLDAANVVAEVDETNNILSRPNASQDPSEDPDGDGVPDCFDECPADPNKTEPGTCGCGVPDTDTDGDGAPDCVDNCPNDPNKLDPGACGCGVVEDLTDADFDGVFACLDPDDNDPDVPNPQPAPPGPQPTPGTGGGLQVVWPLVPALPYPVCGIGLCGSGSMVPLGIMMLGFIGLRSMNRRRRF